MQAIGTLALNLQNKWVPQHRSSTCYHAGYRYPSLEPPEQVLAAMQAIDTLALNLQNKWVFGDCLAFAQSAIQAQDTYLRAAGCTVLVVIAEGCCDACTAKLTDLLQVGITLL